MAHWPKHSLLVTILISRTDECGKMFYLMIGKILGFWLVNWHVIWSCINRSESCINLLVFVCMYVCSFLFPVQRSRGQSWDKFVINCFGVWYNLYLAIRRLYHPRLRLGWYSHLIARYKLYHTPKQLITNNTKIFAFYQQEQEQE